MIKLYVPMLVGALIGWAVATYLGLGGCVGMMAGGLAWLAYETRMNTRRMELDRKVMEKEMEFIRSLER